MTDQTRSDAGLPRRKVAAQGRARHQRRSKARAEPSSDANPGAGQFESALRAARLYVFSQDKTLQHTRIHSPHGAAALPAPDGEEILAVKRKVLESGEPQDAEAFYAMPEGRALFSMHIDPTFGPDGEVDGITCAAIDVTRIRSFEREQQRLTADLGTTLQRYETALRGSNVTVFTHDRALRYTSISNPLFGCDVREIVGRADGEIVPTENVAAIAALKQAALDSGLPKDGEVRVNEGTGIRWYDLHIEPVRDVAGAIVGLTCTAVDITERKEGEAHLRLLMRELTHRSKNLLAVIQAMARQTARHAGSIDGFLDQFSARLQALARSHDLLVQEEWHGVALAELVRSQLAPYVDRSGSQIAVEGPPVILRPEAAQSLGLALHELAVNAVKFGALSTPSGRISIAWTWQPRGERPTVEVVWAETGGPAVGTPAQRGFGSLVVERNLARALEAGVELTFDREGVRCRITIPVTQLLRPVENGA
jgi:PAS domain S-box-containing protein